MPKGTFAKNKNIQILTIKLSRAHELVLSCARESLYFFYFFLQRSLFRGSVLRHKWWICFFL